MAITSLPRCIPPPATWGCHPPPENDAHKKGQHVVLSLPNITYPYPDPCPYPYEKLALPFSPFRSPRLLRLAVVV